MTCFEGVPAWPKKFSITSPPGPKIDNLQMSKTHSFLSTTLHSPATPDAFRSRALFSLSSSLILRTRSGLMHSACSEPRREGRKRRLLVKGPSPDQKNHHTCKAHISKPPASCLALSAPALCLIWQKACMHRRLRSGRIRFSVLRACACVRTSKLNAT